MADLGKDSVEIKPSIIMKVDAPPEDNNIITSQGDSHTNTEQSDSVKITNKSNISVLSSSRLNISSFKMRSSVLSSPKMNAGIVLRPSQLGTRLENSIKNSFALNPSRLNSFAKVDQIDETNNCTVDKSSTSKSDGVSVPETTNGTEAPKFVPLVTTERTTKLNPSVTSSVATTSNFVFGQNLHERVVSENDPAEPLPSTSLMNTNGTSELLFSSAVKNTSSSDVVNKEVKSLSESAREYEESRANKRKYEEVIIVTGEEDEKNVLQINCKLFTFDKATGNWQERGRGTLRLNDKEVTIDNLTYNQSRLVIRTSGSLRVVLNTKIWAEMTIDRASSKSLRMTAMDGTGQIKVFLIMASSEEINQLQRLLEVRVKSEVERQKHKNTSSEPDSKKQAVDNSLSEH